MKISAKVRKQANAIASDFSHWVEPKAILDFYHRVEALGIVIPCWSAWDVQKSETGSESVCVNYELDGEVVENSKFVFSRYFNQDGSRVEYNIYFS